MLKRIIIYSLLSAVVMCGLGYFFTLIHHVPKKPTSLVLFYSKECPHCMIVEDFIHSYDVMTKLKLVKKQVNNNIDDVVAVANYCHLNLQQLQIPLLWTGQQCIIGDVPVINYFKQQLGKQ